MAPSRPRCHRPRVCVCWSWPSWHTMTRTPPWSVWPATFGGAHPAVSWEHVRKPGDVTNNTGDKTWIFHGVQSTICEYWIYPVNRCYNSGCNGGFNQLEWIFQGTTIGGWMCLRIVDITWYNHNRGNIYNGIWIITNMECVRVSEHGGFTPRNFNRKMMICHRFWGIQFSNRVIFLEQCGAP